jgi:hypothetical protein
MEQQARTGIEGLRKGVEDAAGSVLGDEAESLRLAQKQLDDLIRQVDDEARSRQGQGGQASQAGEPNASGEGSVDQARTADARGAGDAQAQGQAQGQAQAQDSNSADAAKGERAGGRGSGRSGMRTASGRRGGQQQGSRPDAAQQPGDANGPAGAEGTRTAGNRGTRPARGGGIRGGGGRAEQVASDQGGGGTRRPGPLTGEAYRPWSDGLREVEEMLFDQDLRNEAATVRDRARAMRAEFTRHGTEPQWDLVQQQITQPLAELRKRLSEKLARLRSNEALVPIDRDPVPGRFAEPVRRYFENLGGQEE